MIENLESDFTISHNVASLLSKSESEVLALLIESTAKQVCGANRERQYRLAICKLKLTLQLASVKAYR